MVAAPNTRSDGTASPRVAAIKFRDDREVTVKIRSNRERARGLSKGAD